LLVHYPRELGNRIYLDESKWDDLIAVGFVADAPLIEITAKNSERIKMVEGFKNHPEVIKNIKENFMLNL